MKKVLEFVPYFKQTDNEWYSSTTCYPTSMGMGLTYVLSLDGKKKEDVGCPSSMQIEDYITKISETPEIKQWMKNNLSKIDRTLLTFKPRTVAYVEEYIFNTLCKKANISYKTTFKTDLTYEGYCKHIELTNLPIILHGNFSSVSAVAGHIVCGVGYDTSVGNGISIVHDPFGNALEDKYKSHEYGKFAQYYQYLVTRDWKSKHMWAQVISKV